MPETISILTHIYYEYSLDYLADNLANLKEYKCRYYFNLCSGNLYNNYLVDSITAAFPGAIIIVTPNKGKDIGGKLALIDLFLQNQDQSKYLILLHDKMSPHTSTGEEWRKRLLSIIQKENISHILGDFSADAHLGLIGAKDFIMDEYNPKTGSFSCTSNKILQQLKNDLGLQNPDFRFIGGTMFWAKAQLYRDFFNRYNPLSVRATLEEGNVLDHHNGSLTHAWERMLSWIVSNGGYTMKGI